MTNFPFFTKTANLNWLRTIIRKIDEYKHAGENVPEEDYFYTFGITFKQYRKWKREFEKQDANKRIKNRG